MDYQPEYSEKKRRKNTINFMNVGFTLIYFIEFLVKVISMGFVLHPHAYLRDFLNAFDFVILTSGYAFRFNGIESLEWCIQ